LLTCCSVRDSAYRERGLRMLSDPAIVTGARGARQSARNGRTMAQQTRQRQRTRSRDDDAPIIPILARKVREVETKAQKGKLGPTNRTKFQVIALLMREERARVKA